jgi:fucose permease
LHLGFALMGVMTVLLGPMLPLLTGRWGLNDTQAGYLFTAQFATSTVGVLSSSVVLRRYGHRLALFLGLSLMGLGAAGLATSGWTAGVLSIACFGAGIGFTSPTTNLLISEMFPRSRAAALNLLNFSWGAGAVACPFLVAACNRAGRVDWFLYLTAATLAVVALMAAGLAIPIQLPHASPEDRRSRNVWRGPLAPALGSLFFVYVGTESSIGGWIASYDRRLDPGAGTLWAIAPSFFWGALLAGRALAPLLLRRLKEADVAIGGLALALGGVLALFLAKDEAGVVAVAVAAGFGLASIFPISIALLAHWFGDQATRVSGVMFGLSGLGGAVMPWLVGMTSTHAGGLKVGLIVPVFGCIWLLAMYLFFVRPRERQPQEEPG